MVPSALSVAVGYSMLTGVSMDQRGALYFACFLVVPGVYVMLQAQSIGRQRQLSHR